MKKAIPEELDFLEKLNTEDRERFFNMTEEEVSIKVGCHLLMERRLIKI